MLSIRDLSMDARPVQQPSRLPVQGARASTECWEGLLSDITLNEVHATNDDGRRRLFAGFDVHMHAAPLLRLVGINVGHPFQDDRDP
jgi:hypothetical protein